MRVRNVRLLPSGTLIQAVDYYIRIFICEYTEPYTCHYYGI